MLDQFSLRVYLQGNMDSLGAEDMQYLLRQGVHASTLWAFLDDAARRSLLWIDPVGPLDSLHARKEWPDYLRALREIAGPAQIEALTRAGTPQATWVAWLMDPAPTTLPVGMSTEVVAECLVTNPPLAGDTHWQVGGLGSLAAHILESHLPGWPPADVNRGFPALPSIALDLDAGVQVLIPVLPAQELLGALNAPNFNRGQLSPDAQVTLLENPEAPWAELLQPVLDFLCTAYDMSHDSVSLEGAFQRVVTLLPQLSDRWPDKLPHPGLAGLAQVLGAAYARKAWLEPAVVDLLAAVTGWPQSKKLIWLRLIRNSPEAIRTVMQQDPELAAQPPHISICSNRGILAGFDTAALVERFKYITGTFDRHSTKFLAILSVLATRPDTPWDQLAPDILFAMRQIPMAQHLGPLFPKQGFPGVLPTYMASVRAGDPQPEAWVSACFGPEGVQAYQFVRALDLPHDQDSAMLADFLGKLPYHGLASPAEDRQP